MYTPVNTIVDGKHLEIYGTCQDTQISKLYSLTTTSNTKRNVVV